MGARADDASLGGKFGMFNPRGWSPMMHAPLIEPAGEDASSAGSAQMIQPDAGLSFLFPSFPLHAVRPYPCNYFAHLSPFNVGLYPNL